MIYISLFGAAFLSATLLPGSSELMFYIALKNDAWPLAVVGVATLGNTLGALANYLIGRFLQHWLQKKWLGFSEKSLQRAQKYFEKWGALTLFLSFLPIIGDPLTAVAGVAKYPYKKFLFWVAVGKMFRYLILLISFLWLQNSMTEH